MARVAPFFWTRYTKKGIKFIRDARALFWAEAQQTVVLPTNKVITAGGQTGTLTSSTSLTDVSVGDVFAGIDSSLSPPSNEEYMVVTAVSGSTLTVQRNVNGVFNTATLNQGFNIGVGTVSGTIQYRYSAGRADQDSPPVVSTAKVNRVAYVQDFRELVGGSKEYWGSPTISNALSFEKQQAAYRIAAQMERAFILGQPLAIPPLQISAGGVAYPQGGTDKYTQAAGILYLNATANGPNPVNPAISNILTFNEFLGNAFDRLPNANVVFADNIALNKITSYIDNNLVTPPSTTAVEAVYRYISPYGEVQLINAPLLGANRVLVTCLEYLTVFVGQDILFERMPQNPLSVNYMMSMSATLQGIRPGTWTLGQTS